MGKGIIETIGEWLEKVVSASRTFGATTYNLLAYGLSPGVGEPETHPYGYFAVCVFINAVIAGFVIPTYAPVLRGVHGTGVQSPASVSLLLHHYGAVLLLAQQEGLGARVVNLAVLAAPLVLLVVGSGYILGRLVSEVSKPGHLPPAIAFLCYHLGLRELLVAIEYGAATLVSRFFQSDLSAQLFAFSIAEYLFLCTTVFVAPLYAFRVAEMVRARRWRRAALVLFMSVAYLVTAVAVDVLEAICITVRVHYL